MGTLLLIIFLLERLVDVIETGLGDSVVFETQMCSAVFDIL